MDIEQYRETFQKLPESYPVLQYIAEGDYVNQDVAKFIIRNFFYSNKEINLLQLKFDSHCDTCFD